MIAALSARDRRKLQAMINRTSRASAVYHKEQDALNDWCREYYGYEPGDVDADDIIDAVFGGCGEAPGMDADDFDGTMRGAA